MLKYAQLWTATAAVAGAMGFTGIMDTTAPITQSVFFGSALMTVLSLLFCLFEEESSPSINQHGFSQEGAERRSDGRGAA